MLGHVFRRRREAADRARKRRREFIQQVIDGEISAPDVDVVEARAFATSVQPKTQSRWYCMWGTSSGQYFAFFQGPGAERGICVSASTKDELWKQMIDKDPELLLILLPVWTQ